MGPVSRDEPRAFDVDDALGSADHNGHRRVSERAHTVHPMIHPNLAVPVTASVAFANVIGDDRRHFVLLELNPKRKSGFGIEVREIERGYRTVPPVAELCTRRFESARKNGLDHAK